MILDKLKELWKKYLISLKEPFRKVYIGIFRVKEIKQSEVPEPYFHYINKTWKARGGKDYDVRTFIFPRDLILQRAVLTHDLKSEDGDDHTAFKCMRWVQKNIRYVGDKKADRTEHWKYPVDTYYTKQGDCEDHAILLTSLMINAGIQEERIRVCCGYAHYNSGGKFGHAYVIYRREKDYEWVQLDTNTIHKTNRIEQRKLFCNDKLYDVPWFAFNSKYSTTGVGYK